MLAWLELEFQAHPAGIDESQNPGEDNMLYVRRLAREKAAFTANRYAGEIVLAADTIVELDGVTLGKPADALDARRMLVTLRGRLHRVITALCLIDTRDNRQVEDVCVSSVQMRNFTDAQRDAYIRSGDPLDKAGAYAIQHPEFQPVEDFHGCMASVMGLPLCHLERNLRKMMQASLPEPALLCCKNLRYDCPIHAGVLAGKELG